jgi:hypothetical protein
MLVSSAIVATGEGPPPVGAAYRDRWRSLFGGDADELLRDHERLKAATQTGDPERRVAALEMLVLCNRRPIPEGELGDFRAYCTNDRCTVRVLGILSVLFQYTNNRSVLRFMLGLLGPRHGEVRTIVLLSTYSVLRLIPPFPPELHVPDVAERADEGIPPFPIELDLPPLAVNLSDADVAEAVYYYWRMVWPLVVAGGHETVVARFIDVDLRAAALSGYERLVRWYEAFGEGVFPLLTDETRLARLINGDDPARRIAALEMSYLFAKTRFRPHDVGAHLTRFPDIESQVAVCRVISDLFRDTRDGEMIDALQRFASDLSTPLGRAAALCIATIDGSHA